MRVGLLGDIHGNVVALAAVLDAAKREAVETLCVTGDFVGYYYDTSQVIRMLEEWRVYAVRGNHENILFDVLKNPDSAAVCRRKYGSGIDRAIEDLGPAELAFLSELPASLKVEIEDKVFLIAHGTPWDTDFYLYPDADEELWRRVASYDADYIVLGHTHYQSKRSMQGKLIVNPGSVGQPRDRKPGAAWAILESETGEIEFRRETYDIATVTAQAKIYDPDLSYLWTVLTRR